MKIVDVIKYEGDNNTFIWKHPDEDFNSLTQLIVHETQEAIFFMNGQALDLFGPGRYTLETQNIPVLGKALNRVFNDPSPFHCEVYFINKTEQMSIKWGTDSKVQYIEPIYGFPLSIGVSGEMSLKVDNSRKLLLKLVGTESILNQQKLVSFLKAFLITKVKTYIAQVMRLNAISIFEIDEKLMLFSEEIKKMLVQDYQDYGLELTQFFVTNIVKPDGERQYERFKDLHFRKFIEIEEAKLRQQTEIIQANTEAQKTIIESHAMATKRAQEGYTYQQERGFDVSERIAENESVGQYTNMGIGLGTMLGVGSSVGNAVGTQVKEVLSENNSTDILCTNCGKALPQSAKFCFNCGTPIKKDSNLVLCHKCNKEVPMGKFCANCGAILEETCLKCGAKLPENTNFCPECGTKKGE